MTRSVGYAVRPPSKPWLKRCTPPACASSSEHEAGTRRAAGNHSGMDGASTEEQAGSTRIPRRCAGGRLLGQDVRFSTFEFQIGDEVLTAHDCCDDASMPMKDMSHDCQAAAGCAAKCFSVYALPTFQSVSPPVPSAPQPPLATDRLAERFGSPPFRPPRI
jgi:hypothetical protein